MAFKVLLRAAPGEFSKALEVIFEEQPIELHISDASQWADGSELEAYLENLSPSVIVNSPPLRSVSESEALTHSVICAYCKVHGTPLIHCSSYRVFGEENDGEAIKESALANPSDVFGEHLHLLESSCAALERHIILRLSWVLGESFENVLNSIISKLVEGQSFVLSDHNYGNPVNIEFIANVVSAICQQILCGAENWGAFHVHGSDKCSEAELGDALVRLVSAELGRDLSLPEVATVGNQQRLLKGNALLAGRRCTDNFGIQLPSWRKGLKSLVRRYLDANGYLVKETAVENTSN